MSRKEEPVITGYYRYTDIWFDWYALADSQNGISSGTEC